jgi:hypothetical protein
MDYLAQSNRIISHAIERLQELIAAALSQGAYKDVQRMAGIAESLKLVTGEGSKDLDSNPKFHPAIESTPKLRKDKTPVYPHFETDHDRLIKIGWSKREKSPYEHKASRELCRAAFDHYASKFDQTEFRMDDVLPVRIGETEIPSYQAYLTLAWLRSLGLIRKRSKDTYQWNCSVIDEYSFDEAWNSTRKRNATKGEL